MNTIYAGNTLGDLSRNMLLGQELEDARAAARANEALQHRALTNQLSMHRDETGLGYADLGQRGRMFDDDLGFRRYQHGNLSAADKSRNQLADVEIMLRREQIQNSDLYNNELLKLERDKLRLQEEQGRLGLLGTIAGSGAGGYGAFGRAAGDVMAQDYGLQQGNQNAADVLNFKLDQLEPKQAKFWGSSWGDYLNPKTRKELSNRLLEQDPTMVPLVQITKDQNGRVVFAPKAVGLGGPSNNLVPDDIRDTARSQYQNAVRNAIGGSLPVTPSPSSQNFDSMRRQVIANGGIPIVQNGIMYSRSPDGSVTPVGSVN